MPELQGLSQGFFVHEFYFGPKGDTLCKTRNAHGRELPAHHLPNEGSCIFCLKRRTQGKNKLMHLAFAQALHKPVHVEAVGIHALKRGEQAAQYQILAVIKAAKHLGTAQGTRAYTELPLAVSIIALFATVAMVGLGAWSILH